MRVTKITNDECRLKQGLFFFAGGCSNSLLILMKYYTFFKDYIKLLPTNDVGTEALDVPYLSIFICNCCRVFADVSIHAINGITPAMYLVKYN